VYTKWRTARWRNKRHRPLAKWRLPAAKPLRACLQASALILAAALFGGCGMLPEADHAELLELIEPPAIAEKPVYTAVRGTIEKKSSGTGSVMTDPMASLYFTEEGRKVKTVAAAVGDQVKKGQVLAELDTDDLEIQMLRKEVEIRRKELEIIAALRGESGDEEDRKLAEREMALLQAEMAELADKREGSRLVAPFDGELTSLAIEPGDSIPAYESAAVVSDLSGRIAAVNFGSDALAALAVGMEAVVDLNGVGERKGRVARLPVDPDAGEEEDNLDAYVLIALDSYEGIAIGTPLSASIVTQRRENAVLIPPSALRTHAGRTYVQAVDDSGSKREIDVEVGMTTATEIEVLKGLEEGQQVVGQ
jgi:membrane fusion protein, macrolide-specific efflux system